ncbi:MAG: DNA-binding protein [Porticoccaceae bacterium]|nr:MAG: DNA-binding protein [Porticoccaceae bacterium]
MATKKTATAGKAKASAANKKSAPITERYTKAKILSHLAAETGLAKKQVDAVLEGLADLIERHVKKRGVGEFVLPGLLKIRAVKRPARKARKGINPATGQEITIPAKPAGMAVRVTPLKRLKEAVTQ